MDNKGTAADRRARLEELKKIAAAKKDARTNKTTPTVAKSGQGGKVDDLNDYLDKVTDFRSQEDRKKEVENPDAPRTQQRISSSLTVAVDQ